MGETTSTQQIKRYFPGSNTPGGFHSFYDYILSYAKASRIYLIKAGPGTGKSTFMKRLADDVTKSETTTAGHPDVPIEYHHCSADPKSIDAIVINGKISVIDATTPHAVEPRYPGAVDDILDFTVYTDKQALTHNRNEIIRLGSARREAFYRAYRYLAAMKSVYDDVKHIYASAMRIQSFHRDSLKTIKTYFNAENNTSTPNVQLTPSHNEAARHLFARAITPDGFVDHMDTIISHMQHHVVFRGAPGTGIHALMQKTKHYADEAGLYAECFHSSVDPGVIDHIIIPGIKTAFSTLPPDTDPPKNVDAIIDANDFLHVDQLQTRVRHLNEAQETYDRLLQIAVSSLNEAKELHQQLEANYIPHMDFSGLDKLYDRVWNEVLSLL